MFTSVLGRYFAPTILLVGYPNLSGVADSVGGQLRGDKLCPFSGVTDSGRVWRKVPESNARSVFTQSCHTQYFSGRGLASAAKTCGEYSAA